MAALPGVGWSAPWSVRERSQNADAAASNQQIADQIAKALHDAKLQGYDIEIEFKDGTAVLKGRVTDLKQKDKATQVTRKVPGVQHVDNRLVLSPRPGLSQRFSSRQVQQASHQGEHDRKVQQIQYQAGHPHQQAVHPNQQKAQEIADALTAARLDGYDIEIRYEDGRALLLGVVNTPQERQLAEQIAQQIPGVQTVENRLRPLQGASPAVPAMPVAMQGGAPMPMMSGMQAAAGHPAMFNVPNLPEYAWPAYAQYPNSAAVSYPTQYSPSAWPYIGPFYPYPQVPLGWRDATLRWDDGFWSLQFRQRTDKWWWFFNPHNW
ncbi:MAG: BON domain-containing protein [Planctomycetaceae bacterium]|nr:MAG: BON domain-containing protein [Planctomycetaceae bacterium]